MAISERDVLLIEGHFKSGTISERLSLWLRRYRRSHKCVSSKAIILILCWSFSVSLIRNCIFDGVQYLYTTATGTPVDYYPILNAIESLVMFFYPLAGFLADTKYGRFKVISRSSQLLLLSFFMCVIFCGIIMTGFTLSANMKSLLIFFSCLLGLFLFPIFVVIIASLVMFHANIIQFGVDQLQDSPADHQSLFIHWYVWAYYLGVLITQLGWSGVEGVLEAIGTYLYLLLVIPVVVCLLLTFTVVLIVHYKKHGFIIDTARTNPYKLVYRVTKFARQHNVPIRRSAFTYCEEDIPSGLDLGKSKYGGPFTTEEVENVKAFFGILKILLSLGIAMFMNLASNVLLPRFFHHVSAKWHEYYDTINVTHVLITLLLQNGFLSSLAIVLLLPLYIALVRPFISCYKIRIFGKIGVGIILLLLSVTCTFITDTLVHTTNITHSCMLQPDEDFFSRRKLFSSSGTFSPAVSLWSVSYVHLPSSVRVYLCTKSSLYERTVHWINVCHQRSF